MKQIISIFTILLSLNTFAAEIRSCPFNGTQQDIVVPDEKTVESIRVALKDRKTLSIQTKLIGDIILAAEDESGADSLSVCELAVETYNKNYTKCLNVFRSEYFLYLIYADSKVVEAKDLDCRIGLNLRALMH